MLRLALMLLVSGCLAGGSGFVGYGKRGVVAGVEGSAGFGPFQGSLGIDRFQHVFGRADLAVDYGLEDRAGYYKAFRAGVGVLGGADATDHFTGVLGGGVVDQFRSARCPSDIDITSRSAAVELQLRYAEGLAVVVAPRFDSALKPCSLFH